MVQSRTRKPWSEVGRREFILLIPFPWTIYKHAGLEIELLNKSYHIINIAVSDRSLDQLDLLLLKAKPTALETEPINVAVLVFDGLLGDLEPLTNL